jgi:phage shock protein PspC (stress-responsive transcriptional regulator)
MTETPHPDDEATDATQEARPPLEPPAPRRLTRTGGDRLLGGVGGGLGRYFNVDPILFRVGFAVLTLAGGAGLLAYLILWLVVPADADAASAPPSRALVLLGTAALVLAALVFALAPVPFWPDFLFGPVLALAILGGIGVLLWRASGADDATARLRRVVLVGGLTLLALAAGCMAAVAAAAGAGEVVAGLVLALGAILVVAAFAGGARWLILPAFVLAVPLAFVSAAGVDVDGGVGERAYRVSSVADLRPEYELGVGELTLDLRDVAFPPGRTDLSVRLGMGHVEILVPEDVCVGSTVDVGMGWAGVFNRDDGGLDVEWQEVPRAARGVARLHIDADIGIGALEVVDDPFAFDRFDRRFGRRHFDFRGPVAGNAACAGARRS